MNSVLTSPTHGRRIRYVMLVLACLVAPSCASGGRELSPFSDSGRDRSAADRIRVEVANLHFNDATVWAIRDGRRVRVGRLGGKEDQTFTIEWNVAMPVAFEVDVVSGGRCRTRSIQVDPNSSLIVTIPSNLGMAQCRIGRTR